MRKIKGMSRSEFGRSREVLNREMGEVESMMSDTAHDEEILGRTLREIEGGTSDAAEEVDRIIETGKVVNENEFEHENHELEQVHESGKDFEQDAQESSDMASADTERLKAAEYGMDAKHALSEVRAAREVSDRDIDFLENEKRRAAEVRAASEQIQDNLRKRIQAFKGRR